MSFMIILLYLINLIFALFLVFFREKDTSVTWAWLLVFLFIPVIGFFLYLFLGYGLSDKQKFSVETHRLKALDELQQLSISNPDTTFFSYPSEMTSSQTDFFYSLNKAPLTHNNQVTLITDGQEKFQRLVEDCKKATQSIHIEYYAFMTDETGLFLLKVLEDKAKEGVSVNLLYDALGSKGVKKHYFKPLIDAGGVVSTYLTSQQALLKFRMNYHDHRKIVVIDNRIGYTGGFNIANQYVKPVEPFGYWRDTHIRIVGPASIILQLQFIMDWNVSVPENKKISYQQDYQNVIDNKATTDIQIISSGPNNEKEQIKLTFIKLILSAKKRVWIQTPYLIPDDTIIDALEIAKRSGVEVKIMVPDKPDHPFIYRATQFFSNLLIKKGIDIYSYNGGFLHSKVLIIDNETSVVGSANQDIRSYKLNFETSAIIFDSKINQELTEAFNKDLLKSTYLTLETFENMSYWIRFKQKISRLFSPLM